MKKALFLLMVLSICSVAYAEPVVQHSGETFISCRNIGDSSVFLNDVNDITSVKDGFILVASCSDLPRVSDKYLKVVGGVVIEMTQAEKDAVDLAETNADLAAFDARIDNGDISVDEEKIVSTVMIKESLGFTDEQIKKRAKQLKREGKL